MLDLACGAGRHTRLLMALGHPVLAVDRDLGGVQDLRDAAGIELRELDLEGPEWPLAGEQFAGIIVCNYLHRPHLPKLAECVAPDGVLLYATFAAGNEHYGRPRNPDFLLDEGELRRVFDGPLQLLAAEEGLQMTPQPAVRQKICAVGPRHPGAV